ncbi:RluA family pseudouridine synthase [Myroides sp. LJL110]
MRDSCSILRRFKNDISSVDLPEKFTFPFFYQPAKISILAAQELQNHLESHPIISPLFDKTNPQGLSCGKMFGVLVVKTQDNTLGYIAAFSGKLAQYTHMQGFAPSVFDLYQEKGFFLQEEQVLNKINLEIDQLKNDPEYLHLKQQLILKTQKSLLEIAQKKQALKTLKNQRKQIRLDKEPILNAQEFEALSQDLIKQSLRDKHELRELVKFWETTIDQLNLEIQKQQQKIQLLKQSRKQKSNALQKKLFQQYKFLNAKGVQKDLLDIFQEHLGAFPPAAAGDCAAPRLLQYAYLKGYTPISMAEFWWGESPKSEIRKHLHYYGACKGKCEPILTHMLQGLQVEDNPLLKTPVLQKELEIIFEDQDLAIVNKPHDFLSVPGIYIQDSVYTRMQQRYPQNNSPFIVHRLDMATSGILIIAKTKKAHKAIQKQFLDQTIRKTYVALLQGELPLGKGTIDLPLRLDLEDRPRQMVCYTHGKPAVTNFQIISTNGQTTKVYFYPITGRTHQLRMHAAHPLGLNASIVGDDLYGQPAQRLYLHAQAIEFIHPSSKQTLRFEIPEDF